MTPDLSIVIVSWNTKALLKDCLESIQNVARAEVFVADNASSDGSPELVASAFPNVTLIQTGANLGFAKANNLALKQAKGRYWLLLNSDTLVPDGALERLVEAMDAHPEAAVAGSLLLNGDGTLQHSWARFPSFQSELSGALERGQCPYTDTQLLDEATRTSLAPFACDWVGGAVFCVRASAAQKAGLLDEKFFMYSEETEWCHRLKKRTGGTTLLIPASVVIHLGGGSSRAVPKATRQRMWRSSLRFFRLTQGPLGALPPSAVATGRYLLSPLRRSKQADTETPPTDPNVTLARLNQRDPLTSAHNQKALVRALNRLSPGTALLYLNKDGLIYFNDQYGHSFGDQVLCDLVATIKRSLPAGAAYFRIGSNEFAILIPHAESAKLDAYAKTLVENIPVALQELLDANNLGGSSCPLGVHIGIALSEPTETGESLLKRADLAHDVAKRLGIGRVAWAPPLLQNPDPLTGVGHWEAFPLRGHEPANGATVLALDIDHLKDFMDTNGLTMGDSLLQRVGEVLLQSTLRGMEVYRTSGGTFALILTSEWSVHVPTVAQKLGEAVNAAIFYFIQNNKLTFPQKQTTLSMGIAQAHAEETLEALTQRAEAALKQAKAQGKNRICWAEEPSAATEHAA
ncbi:diguanylate cyclase domain-containing protein [Armatimonas rosea]|uniref:Diguanylate cyclase (GGDEF)-like protein n=1 Tax=Armatimonas rosea TaxID=685828 RepID=A0A7W9STZ2_ARMRO|nr:diguanylate cyclase [Armatimonas rosea]MBB6052775.1 diguanylate cyclase (GGDEF)-like protein [Armatimonas rosea]